MFEGMNLVETIKLFVPVIIMEFALVVFCLYRLKIDRIKYLPKWVWVLIIICIQLIGGIAFLLMGRERE